MSAAGSRNILWMLGLAAGGAVAYLARSTRTTRKFTKKVSDEKLRDRYGVKPQNLYDNDEVYYV